jgi:bifunctional non-homologous end joining protein LigD
MLATAAEELPKGPAWTYEFKWDGVRALVEITDERVSIRSRRGNEVTIAYPELASLGTGIEDALIDGEIVAFSEGRPSFGVLQTRMHVRGRIQARELATHSPVSFIAFDVLRLYGVDVTGRPLRERRATLARLATDHPGWTVSPAFDDGPATEAAAREHGLEGVVAKRLSSPYRTGLRAPDWIKVRFLHRQEFVVLGWESDATRPKVLSSLWLGYHDGSGFAFAGKVGSGLSDRAARALAARLHPSPVSSLATDPPASPGRVVTWVYPDTVVEVSYSEWAPDGRLRQPVYIGLRSDKASHEVTRDA